ncbi:MAG TPA: DUF58 domain-containing protein [Candidatus Sulfotelmatobacter sp.]
MGSKFPDLAKPSPLDAVRLFRLPTLEVWARFVLALFGLGLAFAAAIFSTVTRDAGNLWATVILASVSLLLAAFVGLVTVPYLAKRVALDRLRDTFNYEVTREGVVYVLVTLVIGIAALNTGNNLLYIVVSSMLSAILVSGFASAAVLRGLELDVRLPDHLFAGDVGHGRLQLRNPRRFLPSFSIRVVASDRKAAAKESGMQWHWEPTTFTFPLNRSPDRQWFRIPDRRLRRLPAARAVPGIFRGSVYFPFLAPGSKVSSDLDLTFEKRGRYREDSLGLTTSFPFSFLTKTRRLLLKREILVYPRIESTQLMEILPRVRGAWESFARGPGSDLHLIREYLPDDSARHVDWKASAKSGSLKVREFTREDERKVCIVFDNPVRGLISEKSYEDAVELAASMAWYFAQRSAQVSFFMTVQKPTSDVYEFLAQLAVTQPLSTEEEQFLGGLLDFGPIGDGEYYIILTARPPKDLPAELLHKSCHVLLENK